MVYDYMSKRKCAYTGKESECEDKVIPPSLSGGEVHNWTNRLPSSRDYKDSKAGNFPTDIEAEIQETFYLLEIARWKAKFLEDKLDKLQQENNSRQPVKKTGVAKKNKEKEKKQQIEASQVIHEIVKDNQDKIDSLLAQKKKGIFT